MLFPLALLKLRERENVSGARRCDTHEGMLGRARAGSSETNLGHERVIVTDRPMHDFLLVLDMGEGLGLRTSWQRTLVRKRAFIP